MNQSSSSESAVRLCMIGAGAHSSDQMYPCLYQLKNAEVTANCDIDWERARSVGSRHGIQRHYRDWKEMIEEERPDGILVCINDRVHAEMAVAIMERGCHVYVEKPHAPSVEASKRMLAASRATGRICMGAYKKRYAPAFLHAKRHSNSEKFGEICLVQGYRAMGGRDWEDGRFYWQWGCHMIDAMVWLGGPVEEVHAVRNRSDYRATCINLRYQNGAAGNLILASCGGNWEEITILGKGGNAVRIKDSLTCTAFGGNAPISGFWPSFAATGNSSELMGFRGEMQAFVDAIANQTEPDGSIESITGTVAVYEAMLRSLDSGLPEAVEAVSE